MSLNFYETLDEIDEAGYRVGAMSQNSHKGLNPSLHPQGYWSVQLRHKNKVEYRNYQAEDPIEAMLGALNHPEQETAVPFDYTPAEEDTVEDLI